MPAPAPASILLVEDEDAIADTVAYALRTDGFVTEHVRLLSAARQALLTNPPDLLLLDVGLPDGSGFDLCREVRRSMDLPIILLTARSEEIDRVVGLELGADDYVVKPFSPRELSLRVKTVLRRLTARTTAASEGLDAPQGHFTLDPTTQRISLGDVALNLTRREYLLLKTLLERPGRICSRELLLDAAWGSDADSGDRTVDTHIKILRAKLKALRPDMELISTHRGMGYSARP